MMLNDGQYKILTWLTSPNYCVVLVRSVQLLGAADEAFGVGQVEVAADPLYHSRTCKNNIFKT